MRVIFIMTAHSNLPVSYFPARTTRNRTSNNLIGDLGHFTSAIRPNSLKSIVPVQASPVVTHVESRDCSSFTGVESIGSFKSFRILFITLITCSNRFLFSPSCFSSIFLSISLKWRRIFKNICYRPHYLPQPII
jgi:hypothetical protein